MDTSCVDYLWNSFFFFDNTIHKKSCGLSEIWFQPTHITKSSCKGELHQADCQSTVCINYKRSKELLPNCADVTTMWSWNSLPLDSYTYRISVPYISDINRFVTGYSQALNAHRWSWWKSKLNKRNKCRRAVVLTFMCIICQQDTLNDKI